MEERIKELIDEYDEGNMNIVTLEKKLIDALRIEQNILFEKGYKEASLLVNQVTDMRKDANYQQLATTFEELLNDRISIKELKDFWRKRAGIKT